MKEENECFKVHAAKLKRYNGSIRKKRKRKEFQEFIKGEFVPLYLRDISNIFDLNMKMEKGTLKTINV